MKPSQQWNRNAARGEGPYYPPPPPDYTPPRYPAPMYPPQPRGGIIGFTPQDGPIPEPPIVMEDEEYLMIYKKTQFRSYTPFVFGLFFLIIPLIFLLGGNPGGGFITFLIWLAGLAVIRTRLWARTGFWFTNQRLVINDGSKIMMVPYSEIALSSISFEKNNAMFTTIYNREFVLKGLSDIENIIRLLTRNIKAAKI